MKINLSHKFKVRATVTVGILAVLWVVNCAVIYSNMRKPPEEFGRFMKRLPGPVAFLAFPFETMWMRARAGSLNAGDQAPDFSLMKVDKSERVQLKALNQSKPVVLVFGSYT